MNIFKLKLNTMIRKCRRDKILIVAMTRNGEKLYVQDENTSEWCYITGGCKGPDYNPLSNAYREFHEETSNSLKIEKSRFKYIKTIRTTYRPENLLKIDKKEDKQIVSYYHVFYLYLDNNEKNELIFNFTSNDEISNIQFTSKLNPNQKKWELMSHLNII